MTVMANMSAGEVFYLGNTQNNQLYHDIKRGTENVQAQDTSDSIWELFLRGVLWNSTARIERNTDPTISDEYITKGNVTE